MEKKEFQEKFQQKVQVHGIKLDEKQIDSFFVYMNLLLEWNQKMNLTAILDPDEIIVKHFLDSLTIEKYLKDGSKVIDIGTGAGFPGIPLAIYRQNVQFLLADSLQKRILFLEEVKKQISLKNVELKHARAEDLGKNLNYREQYDFAVSRAVAPLRTLLEYTVPFVKKDGYCICMKGSKGKEELKEATNSLRILGVKLEKEEEFLLGDTGNERMIFLIKKEEKTPEKYPRKAGIPTKQPL